MDPIYEQPIRMLPPYVVTQSVSILSEVQDYNHRMMNIPAIWKRTRGKGVKVAILDTGMPVHDDLMPKLGHSFVPGYTYDLQGHSTHVNGIIGAIANNGMGVAGIAPDAELYCCAVLGANGNGTVEQIIKGIRWAVDVVGAQIINMSLGLPSGMPRLKELEAACNYATSRGATLFCATGNSGNAVGQPAMYDSVIAVAAVDDAQEHAKFSCYGSEVDFAAGGVQVYSTYLKNGYAMLSGTSMATPALAAVGALIQADYFNSNAKFLTRDELYAKLKKIAFDVKGDGFDKLQGYGIPVFHAEDPAPVIVQPDPAPVRPADPPSAPPVLVGDGDFSPKPGDIPMPPVDQPASPPATVINPPAPPKSGGCPALHGAVQHGLALAQQKLDDGASIDEAAACALAGAGVMMARVQAIGAARTLACKVTPKSTASRDFVGVTPPWFRTTDAGTSVPLRIPE